MLLDWVLYPVLISGRIPDIKTIRIPDIQLISNAGYPAGNPVIFQISGMLPDIRRWPYIRPRPKMNYCSRRKFGSSCQQRTTDRATAGSWISRRAQSRRRARSPLCGSAWAPGADSSAGSRWDIRWNITGSQPYYPHNIRGKLSITRRNKICIKYKDLKG